MDYLYTKNKCEDGDNLFGTKFPNLPTDSDIMDTSWSANPEDILDSIFSMDNDFLNSFDNTQEFETLEDLSERIKMEAEEYETISGVTTYCNTINKEDPKLENISSTSSDSGLSSDNLDIEMSPTYQPLSPAFSSPGPSISERGSKSDLMSTVTAPGHIKKQDKSKVVVQKVPQVLTLSTKNQVNQKLNVTNNNKEIKIVKLSPHMFNKSNNKTVTIQVKNSNSGAKIQANPGTLFLNNGKVTEVKKLSIQNGLNSRSILIPVSIKDVKDLKSFKIINSSTFKKIVSTNTSNNNTTTTTTFKANEKFDDILTENSSDNESIIIEDGYDYDDDEDDDDDNNNNNFEQKIQYPQTKKYPKLILTQEERRLYSKEGIRIPSHYPLKKDEERDLKRIRRKIRNKISAQDSRKRKKEYVDGLEERVKQCTDENHTLLKRIKLLQNQNQNLATQMKKLQSLITKGTNKTAQPTTCLMVLLLSLALVAAPNLKLGKNVQETELEDIVEESILQNRRNLLFDAKDQNSEIDDINMMNDIFGLSSNVCGESSSNGLNSADICSSNKNIGFNNNCEQPVCKKFKQNNEFVDFDVDDQNWYKNGKIDDFNQHKTNNIISNTFNSLADSFKKNMKTLQTSGFNIVNNNDLFDQDVLEMISPKSNGIYELNLDKITSSGSSSDGVNIMVNSPYHHNENDKKLNFSTETQNF